MTDKIIRGSGGPPPTPPSPTRAPDTLNSRQFATIQDLLSEGEIEGFATPSKAEISKSDAAYNNAALKDIFLNDTPILNSSASNTNPQTADFNFQNVGFTPRFGTSNQEHIPGIESSQSTTAVGVTVTASSPVTRQITNTNVDAAKVTITFPQLQKATDQGDLLGSSVQLKIQVQYNSGGFSDVLSDTITGRTADAYQKEYRVNITGAFPVDIRVVRVTADSTSSNLVDAFAWTSIGEIIDDKQRYLNSAYTNLRIDSEQFSSIPKRSFRIRGVKVRIPGAGASSSGTPTVDLQTGRIIYPSGYIFNGTMGAAVWCSCPAMILLDLLTTERYGFGTHITDSNLDLFSFVAASRYANELVSDGFGGQEARFSCNVNLQGSMEAYDLINELAGVMRCFPIWSEGSVTISQDKPTDPSYLFSLANVGEGGFSYSGSSLKQRHTVISVSYFNMDSREIDYEVVEDTTAQAKLGIVKKDVKAFACTSRGQAQRLGKAILFSEQNESEVISFTTSIDAGAIVRPGSVISVNDPVRGGERRSGRINAATTTQITVDNTQDLDTFTGSNKKCSVILPDGTVETKNVLGIIGNVITLDSALSATPNVNAIWLLQSSTLEAQTFRVITVEEQDGINYAITALTYIDGKYDNIESGISLPSRSISLLNEPKNPPSNLQASERIVVINNLAVTKLILSWVSVTGVSQYLVQYRFNNTNWVSEIVFRPDFEILNTEAGTYEFKVYSYNAALKLSATSSNLTFNAVGKTEAPGDVQNLTMEPVTNKLIRLRWTESTDPDVIHGGKVYVRHSNKTDGSGTFQNSIDLIEALAGNTTEAVCPSIEGEYILKFRDDQGNFSTGETSVILDLPDLIDSQQIVSDNEHTDPTPFGGTKTNVAVSGGALELTNPATNLTGTYDFATTLDLGSVFSLNLQRLVQSIGFTVGAANTIDGLIPAGTFWDDYAQNGNFDGPAINDVSALVSVRTTEDNPSSGSPTYTQFNTFANGTFKGRGFQFRATLKSESTAHNISVQQLGVTASFESRTERSYVSGSSTSTLPLSSGTSSSGLDVTFAKPFFVGTSSLGGLRQYKPSLGITIMGAAGGEYFTIKTDANGDFLNAAGAIVTGTGFNISIKDSNDNPVDKKFTFQAVGYGKGV
jgi:predicted phage tail protein